MASSAPAAESDLGPVHSAARDCAPACGGPAPCGPGDPCGVVSHERGGETSATGTGKVPKAMHLPSRLGVKGVGETVILSSPPSPPSSLGQDRAGYLTS